MGGRTDLRDSVVFYRSFYDAIKNIPEADQLKVYTAIMEYAMNDVQPEIDGIALAIFLLVKPQIDANNKRYENGKKPKAKQAVSKSEASCKQNISKSEANVNVKENEKENVNVKEKDKTYSCVFEELWKAYPRKKEKSAAYKAYKATLNKGFSEDELMTAVKRYAEECKKEQRDSRYIKLCSTFLGPNTPFMDYLGEENGNDSGGKTTKSKDYIQEFIDSGGDVDFTGF